MAMSMAVGDLNSLVRGPDVKDGLRQHHRNLWICCEFREGEDNGLVVEKAYPNTTGVRGGRWDKIAWYDSFFAKMAPM